MDFNLIRDLYILVCTIVFCKLIKDLKFLLEHVFYEMLSVNRLSINGKHILSVKFVKNNGPKKCLYGRNDTWTHGHHWLGIQVHLFTLELYMNLRPYLSFHDKMLFEWARFESFRTAPNTLCVSTIKLARAGFYYTRDGHSCKCAFCGFVYQDWRNGDDPYIKHRQIRPHCPFVVSRFDAVNIPIHELERISSPVFSTRNQVERTPVIHNGYVSAFQPSRTQDGHTNINIANLAQNLLREIERLQNQKHVKTLSQQNARQNQGSNSADNPLNNQSSSPIISSNLTESTQQDLTEGQEPKNRNDKKHEPIIPKDEDQESIIPNGEQQEPTIPDGEEPEPLNNLILHNNSKNIADIKYPKYKHFRRRRASLKNLPPNQTLSSLSEFAKSGFFYSKTDDCIRCFKCGIGLRNFKIVNNPWIEHARWSKECPYLLRKKGKDFSDAVQLAIAELERQEANKESVDPPTTQPSISTISQTFTESQLHDQELSLRKKKVRFQDFALLEQRRASFKNWPADKAFLCPNDLAECGFFYTNEGDCVRCFHCGVGLRKWETDDNSWIEHARWSGKCLYLLQKKGKDFVEDVQLGIAVYERQEADLVKDISENSNNDYPPTTQSSTSIISSTVIESQLQVLREDQETSLGDDEIRFQDYKNKKTRIASFKNWPANRTFLSPFDLAECGFFYTEMDDSCRCFQCGIGFKGWGPDDSPWYEHARCSKKCPYVIQKTNIDFVDIAIGIDELERQSANARR